MDWAGTLLRQQKRYSVHRQETRSPLVKWACVSGPGRSLLALPRLAFALPCCARLGLGWTFCPLSFSLWREQRGVN